MDYRQYFLIRERKLVVLAMCFVVVVAAVRIASMPNAKTRMLIHKAELHSTLGDSQKAEALWREAASSCSPEDGSLYLISMQRLGSINLKKNDFSKAMSCFREAAKCASRTFGEQSTQYATALDSLATAYTALQHYEPASSTACEAIRIWEAIAPNSPDLSDSYSNLGAIRLLQGRHNEAELLSKQALSIALLHGKGTARAADHMRLLSRVYRDEGNLVEAKKLCGRIIRIEKSAQLDDVRKLRTLGLLADICAGLNDTEEAGISLEQAIAISNRINGPNSESTRTYVEELHGLKPRHEGEEPTPR